jgi:hypothetical protein
MWIIHAPTKSWYSGGEWSVRPYLATRYQTFEEAQRVAVALHCGRVAETTSG